MWLNLTEHCNNISKLQLLRYTFGVNFHCSVDLDLAGIPQDTDTSSDLMLAQMLQMEFDREFDTQLRREEKKFNGESKGKVLQIHYWSMLVIRGVTQ